MAVADGMGGGSYGDIASNLAINVACDILEKTFVGEKNSNDVILKVILNSIYMRIQELIKIHIKKNPSLKGMGTTLVSLLIYNGKYVWGNMGDSKLYKKINKNLIKLTEDHTYINRYEKESSNQASTAMKDDYGHLLTRCLDGGDDLPDIFPLDKDYEILGDKTLFLLCSDGLILDNDTIYNKNLSKVTRNFFSSKRLEKTANQLVENSFREGSTDNISIILYLNV